MNENSKCVACGHERKDHQDGTLCWHGSEGHVAGMGGCDCSRFVPDAEWPPCSKCGKEERVHVGRGPKATINDHLYDCTPKSGLKQLREGYKTELPNWDCPGKIKEGFVKQIQELTSKDNALFIGMIIDEIYSQGMDDGIKHVRDNPDIMAKPDL